MPTILVIDNDQVFRTDVLSALPSAGYDVIPAVDCGSGLAMVRRRHPDLVLISLDLPGGDALRTILELRCLDPALPILAVSSAADLVGQRRERMAGFLGSDRALTKPVTPQVLFDAITELLQRAN